MFGVKFKSYLFLYKIFNIPLDITFDKSDTNNFF